MHPLLLIVMAIWLIAITPKPRPFTQLLPPVQQRGGFTVINPSAFKK